MQAEINIKVTAPIECTGDQFKEWVEYCLGSRASISIENPLHEYDLEASEVYIN